MKLPIERRRIFSRLDSREPAISVGDWARMEFGLVLLGSAVFDAIQSSVQDLRWATYRNAREVSHV